MTNRFTIAVACLGLLVVTGCDSGGRAQGNIHLPEGDPEKGKAHFVSFGCINCHTIVGAELPESDGPLRIVLGSGSASRVQSYGDLVTSIVNPSHKLASRYRSNEVSEDGESLMTVYNDVMTVSQLTDLVAFLQQYYQRATRPGYQYRRYDTEIKPGAERKREKLDGDD